MVLETLAMTVAEFDEWILQPENIEDTYEYIQGHVITVVSNSKSSKYGLLIGSYITIHVETYDLGHTTGADSGYQVAGERYIPDVGFISKSRMPVLESTAYISMAPDLAVEVVSPSDSQRLLTVKIGNYLAAGTIVWVVYPDEKAIDIYAPNQPVQHLTLSDRLTGADILPDFELALQAIFK